jgi:transposase InsO family protein
VPRLARRRHSPEPEPHPGPDRVNRGFTAPAPNRLWVADATRIPCGEGAFWLAAVRDAFSRRIVGWKSSDRCDTDLVLGALEYGIWSRDVRDQQLIHHSGVDDTSAAPRAGCTGSSGLPATDGGGGCAVSAGSRLSNTTIWNRLAGISVGWAGSRVGHSGQCSAGGRKVRSCRWEA